jgi:hypothetical protein
VNLKSCAPFKKIKNVNSFLKLEHIFAPLHYIFSSFVFFNSSFWKEHEPHFRFQRENVKSLAREQLG